MHDKPTYWEYRFLNQDGIIKTKDGRYFKTEIGKAANWVPLGLFLILLALCIGLYYLGFSRGIIFSNFNLKLDSFMIPMLLGVLENRFEYWLTKYHLIQEDSDDSENAKNIIYPPKRLRKAVFVLAFPVWLFMAMNSNLAMFVYSSVANNPAVIEATVDAADQDVIPANHTNTISLRNLPSDASMEITVTKAVYRAKFYLDGEECAAFDDISAFSFHFFWEAYYPRNEYDVILSDINDGSVLTMDCGNLHREWTFEADEG